MRERLALAAMIADSISRTAPKEQPQFAVDNFRKTGDARPALAEAAAGTLRNYTSVLCQQRADNSRKKPGKRADVSG